MKPVVIFATWHREGVSRSLHQVFAQYLGNSSHTHSRIYLLKGINFSINFQVNACVIIFNSMYVYFWCFKREIRVIENNNTIEKLFISARIFLVLNFFQIYFHQKREVIFNFVLFKSKELERGKKKRHIISFLTSKGCPFSCPGKQH